MRTLYLSLLLALSMPLLAQWQGDIDKYEIYSDSLHLNDLAAETSTAYLSKFSDVIEDATWEFTVSLNFNASANNYACVYLVSDKADFSGNGYYVQIGGADDDVSLFRQDATLKTVIIDGLDGRVDFKKVLVKIKVTRTDGNWVLYSDVSGSAYEEEGEVNDLNYRTSSYFGVQSTYTKTRANDFIYTSFSIFGTAFVDDVPPRLDSIVSLTQYQCVFHFNEEIEEGGTISYDGLPANEIVVDGKLVKASFDTPFVRNDSSLIQFSVSDTSDNALSDNVNVFYESFEVLFAEMLSADKLQFSLNKPVSTVLASNISLEGRIPSSVTFDNELWTAIFSNSISQREIVDLVIENILDDNGDTLLTYTDRMTYFEPLHLDVVINELMPDPNPKVSILPEVEYVELYNNNDFEIILTNWYFQKDSLTAYPIPFSRIEAKGYLLLGKEAAMDSFPDIINKVALSKFPSLSNSGMNLQLRSEQGTVIDSLTYNLSWHNSNAKNGGYALSRIYSRGEAIETNFQSSCSEDGGTPGQANCDQAPILDSAVVLTKYKARFYFNEGVSVNSITYAGAAASEIILGINSLEASFSSPFMGKDTSILTINVQDINGNLLIQEVKLYYRPFEVISAEMDDATHLFVLFNKAITTLAADHILLNNEPASAVSLDSGMYVATFDNPIENRTTVSLAISNVLDVNGDSLVTYYDNITYFNPEFGDLVFNEIMPDPSPVISNLPEAEYIELYNMADFSINLKGWTFVKEDKVYPFPTYQMGAGEYLIVTTGGALDTFPDMIKKIALTSFPSLSNSGMSLQLVSSKGTLIDFIDYENSWHEDAFKGAGGFSLERIDAYNPSQTNNWTSSCSVNGGTPGVENCVADDNPDSVDPYVVNAYAKDNNWIMLDLSEPIFKSELLLVDYYSFSGNQTVTSTVPLGDLAVTQQVLLELSEPMDDETVYTLEVSGIQDLSANVMETSTHDVAICRLPVATEIAINEIMYAPFTGEAEYVELYNNTDIPFDLSQLKITKQETDGTWASGKLLSDTPKLLLPRAYLALSGDAEILSDQYTIDDDAIILVSSMLSLGNESDNIGLLLSNATVIDALNYSDEWHSPLLNDTKGVALERLSTIVSTNVSTNWFSASSLFDYGTPGAENSQKRNELSIAEEIKVSPEVFTPNGDGDNDFTTIHIDDKYEGSTIRVQIFNHRGVVVKELINNALITAYSDVLWDGTDNDGARCPMGSYIVWVEIVTPQGEVVNQKMECVVSVRMR